MPTLKDYLMNLKTKLELNKLLMLLCLPETKLHAKLKIHSEPVKSLKEEVLFKELKTILPLVNLLLKKHSLTSKTPNKILLTLKPL